MPKIGTVLFWLPIQLLAVAKIILDKAETVEQAQLYLKKLSGRRHRVYGGITLIDPQGRVFSRSCKTLVQFKLLSASDIQNYIELGEWKGKAGGYAIQGVAGGFVKYMAGSYSNVVGLSLYDTMKILKVLASFSNKIKELFWIFS